MNLERLVPRLVPLAASLVMLTATGCPWPWGQTNAPTGSPTPTQSPAPSAAPTVRPLQRDVFVSGTAIVNGTLTVKVVRAGSADRVADAALSLTGPTPAWGLTDSTQDMHLDPLEAGIYALQVSAPGYATRLVENLTIDPQNPLSLTVELTPQAGKATGRVLAQGQPLAGARVSSGPCVTYTGADGRYALEGLPAGTSTLTIAKTGYAAGSTTVAVNGQDGGAPDVSLTSQAQVVAFENPTQTFDTLSDGSPRTVATALESLRTALGSAGFTVQDDAPTPTIRVVVCPTADYATPTTIEGLRTFVAGGGKLVLLGEWGGALRYNPEALNRIAMTFGLAFNPDLVRSSQNAGQPGWVKAMPAGPMPAVDAMPQGVTLFESSSLFVLPSSQPILNAGSGGYRIAAVGSDGPSLAAARSYGAGMVVAVGDTSAWTAGSITGNQPVNGNLGETNNREFMLNLFRW